MNKYLITLTPIDKFYFGGEVGFLRPTQTENEKKTKKGNEPNKIFNDNSSSYIIKSSLLPQQTSLLGMLRFLLLSNNKDLFDGSKIKDNKKEEVKKLIGERSFNVTDSFQTKENQFGKIKSLSPCFLQRSTDTENWSDLWVSPLDTNLKVSFREANAHTKKAKECIPLINGYDPKEGLESLFITVSGDSKPLWTENDLFVEDIRIGINRNFNGKTNDDAYYKQYFYRFTDSYICRECNVKVKHQLRFAFYAEFSDDYILTAENHIVSLGGDNSRFYLSASKMNDNTSLPQFYRNTNEDKYKLALKSDAYIREDDLNECLFAINETVSFRFLTSTVDNTKHYSRFLGESHLKRNEQKYNLYKRGSVFYFETESQVNEFAKKLQENYGCFYQIGYNHFEIIEKNK